MLQHSSYRGLQSRDKISKGASRTICQSFHNLLVDVQIRVIYNQHFHFKVLHCQNVVRQMSKVYTSGARRLAGGTCRPKRGQGARDSRRALEVVSIF